MRRADLAILIHAMQGGGAERVTLNLIPEFLARGLAVDLVLARGVGPLMAEVPPAVRVVDCGAAT